MCSHSVMSDSLRPHGLQPATLLCPWGFSRQEYWSGLPCRPPGVLPKPGVLPRSPALQAILHHLSHQGISDCDKCLFRKKIRRQVKTSILENLDCFVPSKTLQFSCSVVSDSLGPVGCSMPGFPVHHQLLEPTQTHVHCISDAIQPSHPLLSPSPPTFYPSQHQSLFELSVLRIRQPKYWSFSFSISPPSDYSGWISFRIDSFDLLAVQGTLKSLLQHQSSKASILWCSAFFIVQLSHPYMTTGKTIALTRCTFVGKVMSLLFNTLSRLVIAFLPRSKCLLIS